MKKIAWIGHLLDRYDQALFALLAPSFASTFFPFEDPVYSLISVFCLMPLGLLSRPIGAYVFGQIGDRYGYRKSFSVTLFGMALATGAIGCLPTFNQVGVCAPILLGFARLLQNFFSAGETTGAAIGALTDVPERKKNFVSSLIDASGMLGTLLGSAVCTYALYRGISWRILFLTGLVAGVVGWWIRRNGEEPLPQTPLEKKSLLDLWQYKKQIWTIAAVSGFSYANYYLITIFFNGFLPLIGVATAAEMMEVNTWILGIDFCLLPIVGALVHDRNRWMRNSLICAAISAVPLYCLLDPQLSWNWIGIRMVFMVLGVCLAAPFHAWSLAIAPPQHRYAVKAIGTAIGSRFLGAPAPAIALWLYQFSGYTWTPALVILGTAWMALFSFPKRQAAMQAAVEEPR